MKIPQVKYLTRMGLQPYVLQRSMKALGFALYQRRARPKQGSRPNFKKQKKRGRVEAYFARDPTTNRPVIPTITNIPGIRIPISNSPPTRRPTINVNNVPDLNAPVPPNPPNARNKFTFPMDSPPLPSPQKRRTSDPTYPFTITPEQAADIANEFDSMYQLSQKSNKETMTSQKQMSKKKTMTSPKKLETAKASPMSVLNKKTQKQMTSAVANLTQGESVPNIDNLIVTKNLFKRDAVGIPYDPSNSVPNVKVPRIANQVFEQVPGYEEPLEGTPLARAFTFNNVTKQFRPNKTVGNIIVISYPARVPEDKLLDYYAELEPQELFKIKRRFDEIKQKEPNLFKNYYLQEPRKFEILVPEVYQYVNLTYILDFLNSPEVFRVYKNYEDVFMAADRRSFDYFKSLRQQEMRQVLSTLSKEASNIQRANDPSTVLKQFTVKLGQLKTEIMTNYVYYYEKINIYFKLYEHVINLLFQYTLSALLRKSIKTMTYNSYMESAFRIVAEDVYKRATPNLFKKELEQIADSNKIAEKTLEDLLLNAYSWGDKFYLVKEAHDIANTRALAVMILYFLF